MSKFSPYSGFSERAPTRLRRGLAGLLLAGLSLGVTSAHSADVFGTATPTAHAASELRDRMTALEKELKELKSQAA